MPGQRFLKLELEKQERILTAAAEQFADHGYDGASLNHILTAAGLSKGAAYYYFEDKADLFRTICHRYWEQVQSMLLMDIGQLEASSYWPEMLALGRRVFEFHLSSPWALAAGKAMMRLHADARPNPIIDEMAKPLIDWMKAWLAQGQLVGTIRTDVETELLIAWVMALDSVSDSWMMARWQPEAREEMEKMAFKNIDCWRRILQPEVQSP
jgi:AcrR family transcriptional regulator